MIFGYFLLTLQTQSILFETGMLIEVV